METGRARPQDPPVIFRDGLGTRHHRDSPEGPLEVLLLHDRLTNVPQFEFLIRDRVDRLAYFRHDSYARVRDVEPVEDGRASLAILSERIPGVRLSRMLGFAEQHLLPVDLEAALAIIRHIAAAVAVQHEVAVDTCHGALAPERILITPDARVVVVEHVLGAALEQLRYPSERYWTELRIALPMTGGPSCLNRRSDVVQIGAIALAVLLGRPLTDHEYPGSIGALVEGTFDLGGSFEPLPQWLRSWLSQTLGLDPMRSFATAIEARQSFEGGLKRAGHTASREALIAFLKQFAAVERRTPVTPQPAAAVASIDHATPPVPALLMPAEVGIVEASEVTSPAAAIVTPPPKPLIPPPPNEEDAMSKPPQARRITADRRVRLAAAAVVLLALTSGGAVAARHYLSAPPTTPQGTLVVDTSPSGANVVIDGKARGVTPLTVTLDPGAHTLVLSLNDVRRTVPVRVTANAQISQFIEMPKTIVSTGRLQVRTDPPGARVSVDGEDRGVSPLTVEGLTPGTHAVTLENDLGAVHEDVTIEADATAALVVPLKTPEGAPVSGWISIAAPDELQIFEDQRLLGSSRADRLMVAAGRHDIDLVNDALGYRATARIQVAPGQVTIIKPDWPRGTIAINAMPWANVWLDGQELGETPVGNTQVPIGTHEVVFRNPELGEQRYTATVTASAPARLSIDMRKK